MPIICDKITCRKTINSKNFYIFFEGRIFCSIQCFSEQESFCQCGEKISDKKHRWSNLYFCSKECKENFRITHCYNTDCRKKLKENNLKIKRKYFCCTDCLEEELAKIKKFKNKN